MTPDRSYHWEGAREQCEDTKWDGGEEKNDNEESQKANTNGAPVL